MAEEFDSVGSVRMYIFLTTTPVFRVKIVRDSYGQKIVFVRFRSLVKRW